MIQLQATADLFLQPARSDALSQALGSEQHNQQISLLHRAYEELRSETSDIAKDLLNSTTKRRSSRRQVILYRHNESQIYTCSTFRRRAARGKYR
jgi:hypothetical protein